MKARTLLGIVWASPITLIALFYVFIFQFLGWYKWETRQGPALIWILRSDAPTLVKRAWSRWGGHALGNVVVLSDAKLLKTTVFDHELHHVSQWMFLGVLFIPAYFCSSLLALLTGEHPYQMNHLEISARRAAGQRVDLENEGH